MTLLLADVLLGLVLEHHNLIALGLFHDFRLGANAFNHGLAYGLNTMAASIASLAETNGDYIKLTDREV